MGIIVPTFQVLRNSTWYKVNTKYLLHKTTRDYRQQLVLNILLKQISKGSPYADPRVQDAIICTAKDQGHVVVKLEELLKLASNVGLYPKSIFGAFQRAYTWCYTKYFNVEKHSITRVAMVLTALFSCHFSYRPQGLQQQS